tara:strand:- start:11004 stop:11474 length:471 start_codon:yes stop_codon:yes gene_type:complete
MSWYKKAQQKVMYILRGISGSGKSTVAKQLGGQVFGSDEFFMHEGEYRFDPSKLGEAHEWNFQRVLQAAKEGISPIIVDNTNTQFWEMKNYVQAAKENGYEVEFHEPDTPWKFDADELAKRNTHGVPQSAIQGMIDRWETDPTVEKVLQSKKPDFK